jgi:hypothetical protein
MRAAARRIASLVLLASCALPVAGWSQEWRASARFGRVTYEGAPAGASAASSLVLDLGRTAPRDWFGASAAVPLGEDPFWAVLGGWKRLETRGEAGLLLDLSGHGFLQRHGTTSTGTPAPSPLPGPFQPPPVAQEDLSGEGVGAELMAGVFAGSPSLRMQSRAGVAAQRSRLGGVLQERALPSGDARLSLLLAPITVQAETRAWLDEGDTHAYAGGRLQYVRGTLQLWGSLGQWVAGVAIAVAIVFLADVLSHMLYPFPAELDANDSAGMRAYIATLPIGAFLMVMGGWVLGTFVGAVVAARIGTAKAWVYPTIVGLLMFAATTATLIAIPHPHWFSIISLLAILASAWLAWLVARTAASYRKLVP